VVPLLALVLEVLIVDAALELVLVGRIDQFPDPIVASSGSCPACSGLLLDVAKRRLERRADQVQQAWGHLQPLEHAGEELRELLLPHELPSGAHLRAAVIHVHALVLVLSLDVAFGRDSRAAVATDQQPTKRELMLTAAGVGMAVEACLDPIEELAVDQDWILALVQNASPVEFPRVDRVAQDVVDAAYAE